MAIEDVRLVGIPLRSSRHICGFFRSAAEEYDVLLPFIKEGLDHGDYVIQLIDPARRGEHMRRLQDFGIDAAAAEERGQMVVQDWGDFFLVDGQVDREHVLASLRSEIDIGRERGYEFTRLIGDMEWTLQGWTGSDQFVEIEARVNNIPLGDGDAMVCTYNLARFGGAGIIDALRIHPTIVIGASIMENPLYVPPDRFLEELRMRPAPALVS